jgi:hypothetical protein
MRLDSSGNLGLGVTPSAWGSNHKAYNIAAASTSHLVATVNNLAFGTNYYSDNTNFIYVTTGQNATRFDATSGGAFRWFTAPSGTAGNVISFTQAMTLDASGRLLLGTTSARTAGGITPALQVESTTVNGGSQYLTVNNATAANSPILQLNRSRGTAVGDVTAVASGDTLGRVFFAGADGTGLISAASISAAVDGTPGTNDMPGRLVFSTTADGASSPTERLRIDSAGNLGLGVTPSAFGAGRWMQFLSTTAVGQQQNGTANLMCNAYESSGNTFSYIVTAGASRYNVTAGAHAWYTAPSGTAGNAITFTQAMTLDASGNLGIGTTSPSASAILDAQSTTKGVRMPNMTTTQKNAIASPAAGLMVYDTTLAKLCVYTTAWETITSL